LPRRKNLFLILLEQGARKRVLPGKRRRPSKRGREGLRTTGGKRKTNLDGSPGSKDRPTEKGSLES